MSQIEKIVAPSAPGIDSVTAYFENVGPGQGRVTIICYDMAWTSYWGGMGDQNAQQFFAAVGVDYLAGCFGYGRQYKTGKADRSYLERVLKHIHQHVKAAMS